MTFKTTPCTLSKLAEQAKIHLLHYFLKVIYVNNFLENIFFTILLRHKLRHQPGTQKADASNLMMVYTWCNHVLNQPIGLNYNNALRCTNDNFLI
jgi:hypothetical protein